MQTNCWSNRDPRHLHPYPVVRMWRQVLGLRKLRCSNKELIAPTESQICLHSHNCLYVPVDKRLGFSPPPLAVFRLDEAQGGSFFFLVSRFVFLSVNSVLKRFYVGSSIKEEASPVMVGLSREDSLLRLFGWSWWRTGRGATKEGNDRV